MGKTRINCSLDNERSPEFSRAIGEFRGTMVDAAEAAPMPPRFSAVPHPDRPAMIICDESTGRATTVGLFAYRAMREALADLFPEG